MRKIKQQRGNKKQNPLPWITFPHASWRPLTFPSGQLHWLDILVYLFNYASYIWDYIEDSTESEEKFQLQIKKELYK